MKNYDLKNFSNGKDPTDALVQTAQFAFRETEAQTEPHAGSQTEGLPWQLAPETACQGKCTTWEKSDPRGLSHILPHWGSVLLSTWWRDELEEPGFLEGRASNSELCFSAKENSSSTSTRLGANTGTRHLQSMVTSKMKRLSIRKPLMREENDHIYELCIHSFVPLTFEFLNDCFFKKRNRTKFTLSMGIFLLNVVWDKTNGKYTWLLMM